MNKITLKQFAICLIFLGYQHASSASTWNLDGLVINLSVNDVEDTLQVRGYQKISYHHYDADGSWRSSLTVYPKVFGNLASTPAAGSNSFSGTLYLRIFYNSYNTPLIEEAADGFGNFCDLPIKVNTLMWDSKLRVYKLEYELPIPKFYYHKKCEPMRVENKLLSGNL